MATTTEELRHLVENGKTDELAEAIVDGINSATEQYKQIKDLGDRMVASGLAALVINTTEKFETPAFLVEVQDGASATMYENGIKIQENVYEFMADRVTNLDDRMTEFKYGKKESISACGLHCVAKVIEYPAA